MAWVNREASRIAPTFEALPLFALLHGVVARRTKGLGVVVIEEQISVAAVRLDVVNNRCSSDMAEIGAHAAQWFSSKALRSYAQPFLEAIPFAVLLGPFGSAVSTPQTPRSLIHSATAARLDLMPFLSVSPVRMSKMK
jgi:hypothetical protein